MLLKIITNSSILTELVLMQFIFLIFTFDLLLQEAAKCNVFNQNVKFNPFF